MSILGDIGSESARETLKHHPYVVIFTLSIAVLCLTVGGVWAKKSFADRDETEKQIENIDRAVSGIQYQLERASIDQTIERLEMQIFELERLVNRGEANSRDISRLDELRARLTKTKRKSVSLDARNVKRLEEWDIRDRGEDRR